MLPKDNSERACEECIHFFACSMQCGVPMAQSSATGCECYETVKSSMAYYVGTLDGAKGKIPNRLRELAEADKAGRVVVHGRWKEEKGQTLLPVEYDDVGEPILHDYVVYRCDRCGRTCKQKEPYCHCGAKMEDGGNE